MKLLLVSSVGGHLSELMRLAPILREHEVVLVVNDEASLPDFPFRAVYRIAHAERDWKVLWNFVEAASILEAERPDVVVSMGAGPAVPFAIVGKYLAGARVLFIETAAAVERPTLTGRLLHPIADAFFYQWPALARAFPRGALARLMFP
jgi:UDP-N-acetylglucosamine:LPS N-acetylglucosamine transferase